MKTNIMPQDNEISLFRYASGELSQDAFLCWLIECADTKSVIDARLRAVGTEFVQSLLNCAKVGLQQPFKNVEIDQQVKGIDILVRINDSSVILIIEDKVFSSEHSGQLSKYRKYIEKKHPEALIGCIYFKVGDQSNYKVVKKSKFNSYLRRDFLQVLTRGFEAGVTNDIYLDFYYHLKGIDEGFEAYKRLPMADWAKPSANNNAWAGFFSCLQQHHLKGDSDWGYVPNARSGFMALWWFWRGNSYLQIEEGLLCFKIEVENKVDRSAVRNKWHEAIVDTADAFDVPVCRPKRFGNGRCMTAAVVDPAVGYIKLDDKGRVEVAKTVQVLRMAESILEKAFKNS